MKRFFFSIAATAALGLAGLASAAQPAPTSEPADPAQTQAMTPSEQPAAEPNTRLAAIVPAGMTSQEACAGFRSVTDCAAALHASQNLNIAFPQLKSKVTGGEKLATAIHALKPGVNAKAEARRAETQAHGDTQAPRG